MLSTTLREQSPLFARLLHLCDCLFAVGLLASLVFWYQVPWSVYYSRLCWIIFFACFISFQSFQLYRSWRGWSFFSEFVCLLKAWSAVIGLLLFYFFLFKISDAYSRVVFMAWISLTPILIFILHLLVRKTLRRFRKNGRNRRHAVVAGAGDLGQQLLREVESLPWAGIDVVGFFDDKLEEGHPLTVAGRPVLGRIPDIADYLRTNDIDYVYIALPMRAEKKIFSILRECRSLGARVYLIPDLYVFGLHHAEIQSLGKLLILNFNPHSDWKRGFDVVFSLLALLCASPIMLIIALVIKLSDGGPVFYAHERVASRGRRFKCLKFRTMRVGADQELAALLARDPALRDEWEQHFKLKNDPRITPIGRFLRRASLDELPQFINVLRGDMSVVGARPIVGRELREYYKNSAGLYCSMKPGITGPWQVGKRSDIDDYHERVRLDDWYILNSSMWTDMKIILKTAIMMFKGKGAY
ncbi:MAG: sugar transferase [Desulfobulbaceae bacterium]|jgi:exopolysaccharide biosynthesis polyprenyl glycosylphosphotransferase|nr:sugar transferase [Desulfobulbaceae bacterium]